MLKTNFSRALVLLVVVVLIFAQASPAFADEARTITLLEVIQKDGKGLIFKFAITGHWEPSELEGYLLVDGIDFGLDCNFSDDGKTLICVAASGAGVHTGKQGVVVLAGQGFYFGAIPAKKYSDGACYDIWAVDFNIENIMAGESLSEEDAYDLLSGAYGSTSNGEDAFFLTLELMSLDYITPFKVGSHCSADEPDFFILFEHPDDEMTYLFYYIFSDYVSEDISVIEDAFDGKLPALFFEAEIEDCSIPNPAYHGFGSLIYYSIHDGDCPFFFGPI